MHCVNASRLYKVEHLAQFGASLIVAQMLPGLLNDFAWYTPKRLGNGYIPASFPFHSNRAQEKKNFFSIGVSYRVERAQVSRQLRV